MTSRHLFLLIMAVLLPACGKPIGAPAPASSASFTPTTTILTSVSGNYGRTDCRYSSEYAHDYNYTMNFSGGKTTTIVNVYHAGTSARCQTVAYSIQSVYNYVLRPSTHSMGAMEIDSELQSYTVTPKDSTVAADFNSKSYLAFTGWTAGQAHTLTAFDSSFRVHDYDIVLIQSNVLLWGDTTTGDGKTAATRPTRIDVGNYDIRL